MIQTNYGLRNVIKAPQSVMWMHVEVHGHLSYELKACFTENIDVDGTVLCLKSVRQR